MNRLIAFLQVFGIILVVIGHVSMPSEVDVSHGAMHYIRSWLYAFHMPLFMFASGYLMKYTAGGGGGNGLNIRQLAIKKGRRLLLPYVVITTLLFLPKFAINQWSESQFELSWGSYFHTLLYPWSNVVMAYWFMPTLFMIFILVGVTLKWSRREWSLVPWMAAGVAVAAFDLKITAFLNLTGVVYYMLWFGAGYYFVRAQDRIVAVLWLDAVWMCAVLFLATLALLIMPFPLPILPAAVGILFSISLGLWYVRSGARFFDHLMGYTFAIYLWSWAPQMAVRRGLGFLPFGDQVPWFVILIASTCAGVYLPWLAARFIKTRFPNRKFLRIISGA